eukprot:Opistho-1_new@527
MGLQVPVAFTSTRDEDEEEEDEQAGAGRMSLPFIPAQSTETMSRGVILVVALAASFIAGALAAEGETFVNIAWYDTVIECNLNPTAPTRRQSFVAGACTWAGIGEKNADMYAKADVRSDGTVIYNAGYTVPDCSDSPKRTSRAITPSGNCDNPLFGDVLSADSNAFTMTVGRAATYSRTVPQGSSPYWVNYVQYGFYHLDQCDGDPIVQLSGRPLTCVQSDGQSSRFVALETDGSVVIREFKYPECSQSLDATIKVTRLARSDLTGSCLRGRGVVASLTPSPLYGKKKGASPTNMVGTVANAAVGVTPAVAAVIATAAAGVWAMVAVL